MTIYALKPRFQNLLRPIVRRLAEAGATANQVTVATAVESLTHVTGRPFNRLPAESLSMAASWTVLPISFAKATLATVKRTAFRRTPSSDWTSS